MKLTAAQRRALERFGYHSSDTLADRFLGKPQTLLVLERLGLIRLLFIFREYGFAAGIYELTPAGRAALQYPR